MKKILLLALIMLPIIAASCKKEISQEGGEGGTIVISNATDTGVEEINTRAEGDDYWLTVTSSNVPEFQTIERLLGTSRIIKNLEAGEYTVNLRSQQAAFAPAYNSPVYEGSHTNTVSDTGPAQFPVVCTQANTGVRFIFDQTVLDRYDNLVATVTDGSDRSLSLTPADQPGAGAERTAYFNPGELKITLKDGDTPVNIGGGTLRTITVSAKQRWTITLKTSSESSNSIVIEFQIEEMVTEKEGEFGVGAVSGDGSAKSPFSVGGAINAMPFSGMWVEGYILGSFDSNFTRAGEGTLTYLVIGQKPDTPIEKGIAAHFTDIDENIREYLEIDSRVDLKGMRIAIKGTVVGKAYFDSPTMASMYDLKYWSLNYFSDVNKSVNYYALNTLDTPDHDKLVLKNAGDVGYDGNPLKIGTAVRFSALPGGTEEDPVYAKILQRDFNRMTAEYAMKMEEIWRAENDYNSGGNFTEADKMVQYARDNGFEVHGHTLIWSEVVPLWLRDKGTDEGWDEAKWTNIMNDYITLVVQHYATRFKDIVVSWDVVNEAFRENGTLRGEGGSDGKNSFWYDKVGPDFIEIAFKTAR